MCSFTKSSYTASHGKAKMSTINLNAGRQLGQKTLFPLGKPKQNKNYELQYSSLEHQPFQVQCSGLCFL